MRGWLACIVVVTHAVYFTSLDVDSSLWSLARRGGDWSVLLFVMISGFVVTGLIEERRENWRVFALGRFFRIYPLYLFALALALLTVFPLPAAMRELSWIASGPTDAFIFAESSAQSVQNNPLAHLFLHLTLMHGVVGNDVLPHASFSIIAPAWSLSLEAQFYLLAPAFVFLLRHPRTRLAMIALIFGLLFLYGRGVFGVFGLPSHVAGGGAYFLIGALTRLNINRFRDVPMVCAAAFAGLAMLHPPATPLFLWPAFVILMLQSGQGRAHRGVEGVVQNFFQLMFRSPFAKWIGDRSYGIYLLHWPILAGLIIVLPLAGLSKGVVFLILMTGTFVIIFALAHTVHHVFEAPINDFGRRLRARSRAGTAGGSAELSGLTVQARGLPGVDPTP